MWWDIVKLTTYTLDITFEKRCKFVVNSEKEAKLLSICRNKQIGCQFEERVNEPEYSSISTKKIPQYPTPSPFLFFIWETDVGWIIPGG